MKKIILIVVPILVIGAVVGLAMMGIINIPGLTPKKAADWKATVAKIFKDHGTLKGDLVVLKDVQPADRDAFLKAAKDGGLDPVDGKDGIKSPKLIEFLRSQPADPAKPKTPAAKPAEQKKPAAKAPAKEKPKAPTTDPNQGIDAIAGIWNKIEVAKLIPITEKYKTPELAKILLHMDSDHVSEFLNGLKPDKAAALSLEIQKQASIVTPTNGA